MQTFLPYPDFTESAKVLDDVRLGNQCYRECLTLLNGGWKNHPASKMWKGCEGALSVYALELAKEMGRRDRWKPEVSLRWISHYSDRVRNSGDLTMPSWLGDEDFHASHRSNLLRKDPVYYSQFGWVEPDDLPYIWPEPGSVAKLAYASSVNLNPLPYRCV